MRLPTQSLSSCCWPGFSGFVDLLAPRPWRRWLPVFFELQGRDPLDDLLALPCPMRGAHSPELSVSKSEGVGANGAGACALEAFASLRCSEQQSRRTDGAFFACAAPTPLMAKAGRGGANRPRIAENLDVCAGAANFSDRCLRTRASTAQRPTPELLLRKATARSNVGHPRAMRRARFWPSAPDVDRTTRALLLRRLPTSRTWRGRRFAGSLAGREQMIEADIMPDVARQDAARAVLGERRARTRGRPFSGSASRVQIRPRVARFTSGRSAASRYLMGQPSRGRRRCSRAPRAGARPRKPLYLAQVALARRRRRRGEPGYSRALREHLADAPCGQGYGQFVLGELAYTEAILPRRANARGLFIKRTTGGRVALGGGFVR